MFKTKYVAMNHGAREGMWIRRSLNELLPDQVIRRIDMLSDNKISFILIKNPKS